MLMDSLESPRTLGSWLELSNVTDAFWMLLHRLVITEVLALGHHVICVAFYCPLESSFNTKCYFCGLITRGNTVKTPL